MTQSVHTSRTWTQPVLVVLTRGRPEELVLAMCKGGGMGGPNLQDSVCVGPKKAGMCNKCKQGGRS